MKSKISPKRWIISFFVVVLVILTALSGIMFVVDPAFRFRVKDNTYFLNEPMIPYVSPGLIRNYDYDTLIVGSSMVQNFDMELFREKLGVQPLHIGYGGMLPIETSELMEVAYTAQKASTFYVCMDPAVFTGDMQESRFPQYMIDDGFVSSCRYFLSHEMWFHYLPIDVCFLFFDKAGIPIPELYTRLKSIDSLGDWRHSVTFSEEVVLSNYHSGKYSVSSIDTNDLYNRMTMNMDVFFSAMDFDAGEHVFFFPPYSSLYWCGAEDSGYFDIYIEAKRYFVDRTTEYGATVYDFQSADLTSDLNNYKDTTHYSPMVNDWMVECFASGDYIVTEQNFQSYQDRLRENTAVFRAEHMNLFE